MSVMSYLCSDIPLPEYPAHVADNPSKMELPEGVRLISAPQDGESPEIWTDTAPCDENDALFIRRVNVSAFPRSSKPYCAVVEWDSDDANAERLIRYIREQCQRGGEVELWRVWADNDTLSHRIRSVEIPADEFSSEDLKELHSLPVWEHPLTDYRYKITA